MPFDERIQYVTDYIYQIKQDGKIKRLVKGARFRFPNAEISSVHFEKRDLDKRLLFELRTCAFIRHSHGVVCTGFIGAGKSYLSCAIGKQACKNGHRVKYWRLPDLLEDFSLQNVKLDGRHKLIRKLQRYDLLILDERMSSNLNEAQLRLLSCLS